jgi:Putative collagen-binding domain of a collagenase
MRKIAFILLILVCVSRAGADQSQALRVSDNRHYLEFRGEPILPIGDSVTQGWMECGTDFDQRAYLDALAARGINVVLLWSYIGTGAEVQRADERIGYDTPELWPWKGSPDDRSFDLTRLNPAYFQRLRRFVRYAESKNIVVVITVQDGWTKTRFAQHPFNAALGNGPLTDRRQFVELADYDAEMPDSYDPRWTWRQKNQYFQERFAEALCREFEDCSNVIFEMFNEGEWYDQQQRRRHEEHFLRFFRKRTSALLMTNIDHIRSASYSPRENPAADILSFHKKPWTGHYATFVKEFRTEPVRVIFESEPVPSFGDPQPTNGSGVSLDELRAAVWERALSGCGWVAQNDTSFGWAPKSAMAGQVKLRDAAYDLIGYAARFFNESGVRFWKMAPHGELTSTGFCLAQPGVEYVVYTPTSSVLTVDLTAAKDKTLKVRWYDPRRGRFGRAEKIDGGSSSRQFTPPFGGDAVLDMKSVSERAVS